MSHICRERGIGQLDSVLEFFSKPVLQELIRLGLEKPTEIQRLAFPKVLSGKNTLIIAPTGEGKTEAAVFPVFEMFLRLKRRGEQLSGISILYVTPLRALNRDIMRRLVEVGGRLSIKVEVRHGDTSKEARKLQAETPPNMLITTPETLQAIMVGRKMSENLKGLRWLVADEIHELADDKRGVQLSLAFERLSRLVGRSFQRIGLSATVGDAETVGRFLVGVGRNVHVVKSEASRWMQASVESPSPTMEDIRVSERLMVSAGIIARVRRILEVISGHRSTLVFTNTREHAESLASKIRMVNPALSFAVHHGSISRDSRVEAEQQIKDGRLKALICTSSMELGVDIGYIDFVVQYQSPKQTVKLIQRVGRSGHTVGGRSRGCIIATWPDDILESAVIIRRALEDKLEKPNIHRCVLDVLAHQVVGLALSYGSISLEDAYRILTKAFPYADLPSEEFAEVVKQLAEGGKLRLYYGRIRVNSPRSHQYYFENLSMITEVKRYLVVDYAARRRIGHLDQEFVTRHGKPGNQFILHGSAWQILSVDEEKELVEVESVEPSPAAIPSWEGEVIPVDYEVAMEVGQLRRMIGEKIAENSDPMDVLSSYGMDDSSKVKVVEVIRKHLEGGFPLPHDGRMVVESFENYIIVHGCFGDKPNRALSRFLASTLTAEIGLEVAVQSDPYRIALVTPYPLDPNVVATELRSMKPGDVQKMIEATLDRTNLFLWRLWNNARRFGVVSKQAEYRLHHAQSLQKALRGTPLYRETYREIGVEDLAVEELQRIVNMVNEGKIKVEVAPLQDEPSPLSTLLLDKIAPHDLLRPVKETSEIIPLIRERLNRKTVRLICVFKGDWSALRKVSSLPNKVKCPVCGSTLIAATYEGDRETEEAIKKKLKRKKLSEDEERLWRTAWKSASLIQNYGKKAVIAMAARGVGPTKAVKVFNRQPKTDEKFYGEVLKAEREYLRTKMFWD